MFMFCYVYVLLRYVLACLCFDVFMHCYIYVCHVNALLCLEGNYNRLYANMPGYVMFCYIVFCLLCFSVIFHVLSCIVSVMLVLCLFHFKEFQTVISRFS